MSEPTATRAALLVAALTSGLLPGEREALDDQLAYFEGDDNCGGWTWDPPCGGCSRCCRDQASYYAYREADRRRRMASLGLLCAVPMLDLQLPRDSWPHSCSVWQRIFG